MLPTHGARRYNYYPTNLECKRISKTWSDRAL